PAHAGGFAMLEKVARYSYEKRWRMLAFWVIALVVIGFLGSKAGGDYARDFRLPGSESQQAFDLLKHDFHAKSGGTVDIVFADRGGVRQPAVRSAMGRFFRQVQGMPHVDSVPDPYAPTLGGQAAISRDGTVAYSELQFSIQPQDVSKSEASRLIDMATATSGSVPGLDVELGGQ